MILKLIIELFKNRKELSDIREMLTDRDFRNKVKELYRSGVAISFKNDSFARETIKYRFKDILSGLNAEIDAFIDSYITSDDFIKMTDEGKSLKLKELKEWKFSYSQIQSLQLHTASQRTPLWKTFNKQDVDNLLEKWESNLSSYGTVGAFFNSGPFIDVEHFFYFAILQHIEIKSGMKSALNWSDPYVSKKEKSISKDYKSHGLKLEHTSYGQVEDYESKIKHYLRQGYSIIINQNLSDTNCFFEDLLRSNLSANSTDLSQMFWSEFRDVVPVVNHSNELYSYVSTTRFDNVNILVDNYGHELLCDLILGLYLIQKNITKRVTYHVNILPIFVSDVIEKDFDRIIRQLKELCVENSNEMTVVNELESLMVNGQFAIKSDFFWNMPTKYSELFEKGGKDELKKLFTGGINGNDLLIIKGDLNYRRTVGDTVTYPGKDLAQRIKNYIKCPTLIIRSFKSNVILLGSRYYKPTIFETNYKHDYGGLDWRTEGKAGVIQFIPPRD